jgi:hypothetical protein
VLALLSLGHYQPDLFGRYFCCELQQIECIGVIFKASFRLPELITGFVQLGRQHQDRDKQPDDNQAQDSQP